MSDGRTFIIAIFIFAVLLSIGGSKYFDNEFNRLDNIQVKATTSVTSEDVIDNGTVLECGMNFVKIKLSNGTIIEVPVSRKRLNRFKKDDIVNIYNGFYDKESKGFEEIFIFANKK